jgi:hypothetical protein
MESLRNGTWELSPSLRYWDSDEYDEPAFYGTLLDVKGATSFPTYNADGSISGQCQVFVDEIDIADAMRMFPMAVSSRKMRIPFHVEVGKCTV